MDLGCYANWRIPGTTDTVMLVTFGSQETIRGSNYREREVDTFKCFVLNTYFGWGTLVITQGVKNTCPGAEKGSELRRFGLNERPVLPETPAMTNLTSKQWVSATTVSTTPSEMGISANFTLGTYGAFMTMESPGVDPQLYYLETLQEFRGIILIS